MRTPIQAILFDLDGTLIDTEPSAAKAVKECFSNWNMSIKPEDASYVTGRTWASAFDYLAKQYSIPISEQEAKKQIMTHYRILLEENLTEVPGAVQAVKNLSAEYTLGLVSGSGRQEILWALNRLKITDYFQVILGAEDYPRSKPQPDGYLKAVQFLNTSPSSSLVFEDSTAGIQSARNAGLWVVAVTSTNHFQQDLTLAHMRIPDLRGITKNWPANLSFD